MKIADGDCCSGLDVQIAPRKFGEFLKQVNGFLNQAKANVRNCGVQVMLCPCIDCLNQKKFGQQKIIFYHLVTCGFTKNNTCWNNMVRKTLMNLKQDA
jgi:hypothetical protein